MRNIPVLLFGIGGVGRALVQQILSNRQLHEVEYDLSIDVMAVCDSNGAIIADSDPLGDETLQNVLTFKSEGGRLADHPQGGMQGDLAGIIDIAGRGHAIVVDCTASKTTVPALLFALDRNYKVALANKIPLTVDMEVYNRLTRAGATDDRPARQLSNTRWETTVGAGLPVIATLNRLIASGDEVSRMAGTFSGTLGYVMTGLQEGQSLSAVVREAHRLGYTEPDPRDDLGGIDVARKALILARGLGWSLEMPDVAVEGLYPPEMDSLSVDEFMDALPELDESFGERVQEAAAAGNVLRYAATIEAGQCRVGPTIVPAGSPLGRLSGTDNLIEFSTDWYSPNPLVIQGAGAGADVTAAGVLSDIVELTFTAS